jgi:hypothetical protein
LHSDVTFSADAFSYKKHFYPRSYVKPKAILSKHSVFLRNLSKFKFVIFSETTSCNITRF